MEDVVISLTDKEFEQSVKEADFITEDVTEVVIEETKENNDSNVEEMNSQD